jgi:DNA-binding transcriptional regulator/RsmH inhibitor MraZ
MKPGKQDSSVGLIDQRESTVLDDGRIKLPADVLRALESLPAQSKTLYPGRIPLAKALILCPKGFWEQWKGHLQSQFPLLKTHPGAAAYLHPFKPIKWDREGRISLPAPASHYAGIGKSVSIVLIGKGYYFEVWREDEFHRAIAECEAALRKTDSPPPNGPDFVEDAERRRRGGSVL